MTAKELVLERAPSWSEEDAEIALRAVEQKHQHEDPMIVAFRDAPEDEDDEPLTVEEVAALEQSHEEYRRGEWVPLEEIKQEFDLQ